MTIWTAARRQGAGRAGAGLVILAALALSAPATAANNGTWCACGVQGRSPATFEIDHPVAWQRAAKAELGRWNRYADVFRWRAGDRQTKRNRKNEIAFLTPEQIRLTYGIAVDDDLFGIAFLFPSAAFGDFNACPMPQGINCGTFRETDVILNASFPRGWTTAAPNFEDTGKALYAATALHEIGHAIGLHHLFDGPSTMNYYHDFAGRYLTRSDGEAIRNHYPDRARRVVDIATYPFRFDGFMYDGVAIASVTPNVLRRGESFVLRDFTVENVGSEPVQNLRLWVYFSADPKISASDHLIGVLLWDNFATWWETSGWIFQVPVDLPPGTYYVGAMVTYGDAVKDKVTYNNKWALDAARRVVVQ